MKKQLLTLFAILSLSAGFSATYIVTNTTYSGPGSLHAAVDTANYYTGQDTIIFSGISYPNSIYSSDINIFDSLVIIGPGANLISVGAGQFAVLNSFNKVVISGLSFTNITGLSTEGSLTISNCTFSHFATDFTGSAEITNCSVFGGTDGIYNNGMVSMTNCTISGVSRSSTGAAINNSGTFNMTNCTISGNSGIGFGGAINNNGSMNLTNCTVSGNSVTTLNIAGNLFGYGGGIFNSATLTLMNCTVAENTASIDGPGLAVNGGSVTLTNTIFYHPAGDNYFVHQSPAVVTSGGANISGDATLSSFLTAAGDANNTNPLLNPLGSYGGFMQTHSLQCNSPAINAGTASGAPLLDQRGMMRQGILDIGAFEVISGNSSVQPVSDTVCANDNTGFSVTAQATGFQWQENSGSGFINLVDTGIYSNTTSPSMAISAASQSMNSYIYRCIAFGDCGNDTSSSVTLTVHSLPDTGITLSGQAFFCQGDSVILTATDSMFSYAWSTFETTQSITVTASGNYAVLVTDSNNCSASSVSQNVVVFASPSVSVTLSGTDSLCADNPSVTLSGESPSGGSWSGTAVSGNSFDPSGGVTGWNIITYSVTDTNSCTNSASDSIFVDQCLGTSLPEYPEIVIYPNPTAGVFYLSHALGERIRLTILNAQGSVISSVEYVNELIISDISMLPKGIYTLRITSAVRVTTKRIILQ